MKIRRRQFLGCVVASAFILPSTKTFARDKTLRVLVGYAPGGAADTVARAVGEGLRDSGLTAIVENKGGAGGRIALETLLAAPADGTSILMTPLGNLTLYPHVYKTITYDPLKQFTTLGTACTTSFALAVGANSPAKTLREFLDMARKDNSLAAYGTPGAGTAMHFIGQLLGKSVDLPLTHVAYKGGAAAVTDVIGGNLPALITTVPNLLPMHRAGKLRILAISDDAPLAALPDVPTFKSLGFPDLVVTETFAFFARTGTPAVDVNLLSQAIDQAVRSEKVARLLRKQEYLVKSLTPDELEKQMHDEYARWAAITKSVNYIPEY